MKFIAGATIKDYLQVRIPALNQKDGSPTVAILARVGSGSIAVLGAEKTQVVSGRVPVVARNATTRTVRSIPLLSTKHGVVKHHLTTGGNRKGLPDSSSVTDGQAKVDGNAA